MNHLMSSKQNKEELNMRPFFHIVGSGRSSSLLTRVHGPPEPDETPALAGFGFSWF